MARSAQTFDSVKQKQEGWMGFSQTIENEVFPSLHSYEMYKKLENGALLSQFDAYKKKKESLALLSASDSVTL